MLSAEHRQLFAAAAALRQRRELSCLECGQRFSALAWSRYCSRRCGNRASQRRYRRRHGPLRGQTLCTPADVQLWSSLYIPVP